MTVFAEFIGGPWDGVRRELEEAPWQLRVQVAPLLWVSPVGVDVVPPVALTPARDLTYRLVPPRFGVTSPVRYVLEKVA